LKFLSTFLFNTNAPIGREPGRCGFDNEIEMSTAQQNERIYRIWSAQQEDQIAIRVQFSVEDAGPARLFVLGAREEWV
jgi:hypothetical protein